MSTPTNWELTGSGNICDLRCRECWNGWKKAASAVRKLGRRPNDLFELKQTKEVEMRREQIRNRKTLENRTFCIYNKPTMGIGRPPKPEHLRRSKLFPLRLTPGEMQALEKASRD